MIKDLLEGIAITHCLPCVLYRYENDPDKQYFEQLFGDDFAIVFCDNEQLALQALADNALDAIFIEYSSLADILHSPLLAAANARLPHAQKILLNVDVSLDGLIQLLDKRSLTKCFAKPYDANLIKSTVFAAQMRIQEPIRPRLGEGIAGCTPTVLIVDDETSATKYLKKNLHRLGAPFAVVCAADAQQALDCLEQHKSSLAVIMSDHKMPGMQGSQLLNQIRNIQPNIVRILTSAYGEVDVALGAINEGSIFQYIKKPWDAEQVLACINQALHKHQDLLEQNQQSSFEIDQHHLRIIDSRIERITAALIDKVDAVAGQGTLTQFLACLADIQVSASYAPAIRASNAAQLEADLVDDFCAAIAPKLDQLNSLKKPHSNHAKDFIAYAGQQEDDAQSLASYLYEELHRALTILLTASGIDVATLNVDVTASSISIRPPSELKIYSHLLGPIKKISDRFIQQQTALLMLFVTAGLLEAELSLGCNKQSLTLCFSCALQVGHV